MNVKIQERGWGGHFILANRCRFRRNTLLTYGDTRIVVSTVGRLVSKDESRFERIGMNRYFETMAFYADKEDTRYYDADIEREVPIDGEWCISEIDADDRANDMHEAAVREISVKLINHSLK